MIGFHSVIERPEPVSRVAPPTMTSAKTSAAVVNSQMATGLDWSGATSRATDSPHCSLRRLAAPEGEPYAVAPMKARARKAIGGLGMLAFLAVYVWIASSIGTRLPNQWAIRLAYYAAAGIAWGLPLIPLISWMNRGE